MAVKNKSASVLARLRNQAKEEGISYQMSLQLFFQEEFLRRLSHSRYKDNLILKGGMFIYVLTEFDSRPTRDMDFMIRSLSNELSNIRTVMEEICGIQTDNDYIWLEVTGVEQITLEKQYPGVKTKFIGHINNVRVPFSVDVGIDDVIVPGAEIREIATRLEGFEAPEIYTYYLICQGTIDRKVLSALRKKSYYDIGDALLQKTVTTDFLTKKRVVNKGIVPQYYVENSHEAIIPRDIFM
ncbi:MAG: nucleotidyl transferase AbiEii/AbiGii toxin family protein [Clostridiales bacterium]|nr:nucleotidyl transferase AbiEii/AbiGii toxin family protein [Clostridiales bacterium]